MDKKTERQVWVAPKLEQLSMVESTTMHGGGKMVMDVEDGNSGPES